MEKETIRLEGISKSFGPNEVLKGIDLSVYQSEALVLIGASGSGKSTLLRCMNLLEYPTSGRLLFEGNLVGKATESGVKYVESSLHRYRANVGMVFQQFNLFPHLTVEQNVTIALRKVRGLTEEAALKRAKTAIERVGLPEKLKEYPSRLSGGQQQRVAIARALAMDPAVILFDEATSALDPELVGEVLQVMRQLKSDGVTMVVVTHELGFAYHVADRVVFLHQGRINAEGPPKSVLLNPPTDPLKDFLRGFATFRMPGE